MYVYYLHIYICIYIYVYISSPNVKNAPPLPPGVLITCSFVGGDRHLQSTWMATVSTGRSATRNLLPGWAERPPGRLEWVCRLMSVGFFFLECKKPRIIKVLILYIYIFIRGITPLLGVIIPVAFFLGGYFTSLKKLDTLQGSYKCHQKPLNSPLKTGIQGSVFLGGVLSRWFRQGSLNATYLFGEGMKLDV